MKIYVCIGSCCHKRHSYTIMKELKSLIDVNNLSDSIEVLSAFCLGQCKNGVTLKINDQIITSVTMDNLEEIFFKYINIKP